MRPLVHVAVLAGALALAGCIGSGTGPRMVADAAVDEPVLEPGTWANMTYRLENRGRTPYTYRHPGCPPAPVEAHAEADGGDVELYRYRDESKAGACAIQEVAVDPGSTVEGTVNWNGHRLADAPDPHAGERLPAGTYTVTIELVRADDGPGFPADVTVEVQG